MIPLFISQPIVLKDPHFPARNNIFTRSPFSSVAQENPNTTQASELIQGQMETSIFDNYKEIKCRNELLKVTTYNQFQKQTSSTQHNLLLAFDTEKGRIQMAFLQAQVLHCKSTIN